MEQWNSVVSKEKVTNMAVPCYNIINMIVIAGDMQPISLAEIPEKIQHVMGTSSVASLVIEAKGFDDAVDGSIGETIVITLLGNHRSESIGTLCLRHQQPEELKEFIDGLRGMLGDAGLSTICSDNYTATVQHYCITNTSHRL